MKDRRLELQAALELVLARALPGQPRRLPLAQALGLAAAEDLRADRDVPTRARSALDGYALLCADTAQASPGRPVSLRISGTLRPSTQTAEALAPGTAWRVLTGASLPAGAEAVAADEDVRREGEIVRISAPVSPGHGVRHPGSELARGTLLLRRGEPLTPAPAAAVASLGRGGVAVFPAPRVLVLAVGNELLPPGAAIPEDGPLLAADNLLLLEGLLRENGAGEVRTALCANEPEVIIKILREADAELILTTGGTGPGDRDHALRTARDAGFEVLFQGLALHPARSTLACVRPGTLLFGLPGTPPAAFTAFQALALPALCALRGLSSRLPIRTRAVLEASAPASASSLRLTPCTLRLEGGRLLARPLGPERCPRARMLATQGLLAVPPGPTPAAEDLVEVLILPGRFPAGD